MELIVRRCNGLFGHVARLGDDTAAHQALRRQGLDLQNILRQSYDYLTITPKLRSTYDGRLIYKTSHRLICGDVPFVEVIPG